MRVAISGATGLIGSALQQSLGNDGHQTIPLVRTPKADGIPWDPQQGTVDLPSLEGIDAVIHLAGENIAAGRWTQTFKDRVLQSRTAGTATLARAVKQLARPPRIFVCASAIGYFGDRGDEILTEESPPGTGFLPTVCRAWEDAAQPAGSVARLVLARFGVVLARQGGALAKMLLPFRLGVGGVVGSGRQYMSWISLRDAVGGLRHLLDQESLAGPVHLVAPNPVTNREFTRTLGRVLGRPTFVPLPAFAARLAMGEMADGLLLASTRVVPQRLQASGFRFQDESLEPALRTIL
jgi:uncharacterized protein (TIGR01777 family)